MKKLLSILTMGIAISANAQQQSIVKVPEQKSYPHATAPKSSKSIGNTLESIRDSRSSTAGKGTNGVDGEWFSFIDAQYTTQPQSRLWIYPMYQDSSLLSTPDQSAAFNWWIHGLGTSFDPTSKKFDEEFINLGSTPPTFKVQSFDNYLVDSVFVLGFYDRVQMGGQVDTLFIDVAAADINDTNHMFRLTYNPAGTFNTFLHDSIGREDSKLNVAYFTYDPVGNRISDSVVNVQRIVKILDDAAFADTNANGFHAWAFPINLPVAAGGKVTALATYKSGVAYPMNTDLDSANKWYHVTYEINGENTFPGQNVGDYNAGLVIRHYEKYSFSDNDTFDGHLIPITTYFWGREAGFDDPYFDFHIKCPDCVPTSVINVNASVSGLNAYPNPANNEVNVVFTGANAGKANVTVSNAIGQVVAGKVVDVKAGEKSSVSFSTANLANGVYFYTVEANGQRQTSRFVVAH